MQTIILFLDGFCLQIFPKQPQKDLTPFVQSIFSTTKSLVPDLLSLNVLLRSTVV